MQTKTIQLLVKVSAIVPADTELDELFLDIKDGKMIVSEDGDAIQGARVFDYETVDVQPIEN